MDGPREQRRVLLYALGILVLIVAMVAIPAVFSALWEVRNMGDLFPED